ncbi:MAG: hypothetical protein AAGC93_19650 [Cyanobacteria bacterium P01_F01_bin.53]
MSNPTPLDLNALNVKTFSLVTVLTSIWINISEVFRYFILVRPETQTTLAAIPNVADMNWGIFAIWGVWDTVLTAFVVLVTWLWLRLDPAASRIQLAMTAGSTAWLLFLLFWVAQANMGLARWAFVPVPLVLSWLEMVVGAYIAAALLNKPAIE